MTLSLTVEYKGETEKGLPLAIGDTVEYLGHIPGGMVNIKMSNGEKDIAHPLCFKELR